MLCIENLMRDKGGGKMGIFYSGRAIVLDESIKVLTLNPKPIIEINSQL